METEQQCDATIVTEDCTATTPPDASDSIAVEDERPEDETIRTLLEFDRLEKRRNLQQSLARRVASGDTLTKHDLALQSALEDEAFDYGEFMRQAAAEQDEEDEDAALVKQFRGLTFGGGRVTSTRAGEVEVMEENIVGDEDSLPELG